MKHLLLISLIFVASGAGAQSPMEEAIDRLEAARTLLQAPPEAVEPLQATTQAVRAFESAVFALRAAERDLESARRDAQQKVDAEQADLSRLLGALVGVSRTSAPAARVHPQGPIGALRAGVILADLAPSVAAKRAELVAQAERLAQIQRDQGLLAEQVQIGLQEARAARTRLLAQADQTAAPSAFTDDAVQTALLVANAETLQDFADQVATLRPDAPAADLLRGALPPPVPGRILPDDGSGRPGLRLGVAANALVTTPVAATVLYQGPFLGYGQVVILEPAPDVMFVLAGLEQAMVAAGDILPAGGPVGLMPGRNDGILTENVQAFAGQRATALYLEVREMQTPTDPRMWFALED